LLGRYNNKETFKEQVEEINNVYKEIAKNNNIIYINIGKDDYYINDAYNYPNISGYEEISKLIIKAMNINNVVSVKSFGDF
jgi:hypothetical protein